MHKTVVLNVVGLTPDLICDHTPRIKAFARTSKQSAIGNVLPAVTCSVQSTYLTGKWPSEHGVVANGWLFRDELEVKLWRQSNRLVTAPKVWDVARQIDPKFTCANICWWYNMYSSVDFSVTPRPMYPADGRKIPDCYTHPNNLRDQLQHELGTFPLFQFWGPATSIKATQWIADASMIVDKKHDPTLSLVYLPHLDYGLQRHGPNIAKVSNDLREVDAVVGGLIDYFTQRGARVIILSEYGIFPVSRPIHINRLFRQRGWVATRTELGRDVLDVGASRAIAMADHQIAHVYVNDGSILGEVKSLLESTPGIATVLDDTGKRQAHLDHERSGELVAVAEKDAWFTYYYWLDETRRPDYADTVDIHRKPGYDPAELFVDPAIKFPKLMIAATLAKRKLFNSRSLMNVIGTDATLVKGSHGATPNSASEGPVLLTNWSACSDGEKVEAPGVFNTILSHLKD